jgi:MFS family permease
MTTRASFLKSGHFPTLIAALLYFDVSFMVWVLLGPLAPFLREQFGLSGAQQGLLVAVPLLGGSLFRPLLGTLGDRIGGRRAGLIGLALTLLPLLLGWKVAHTLGHFYVVGFLLGVAGASFAVALPLASGWYPAKYQGLAMGIAGAGNSGSLLATLAVPRLAQRVGWATTFGLMMIPVVTILLVFVAIAKDSPRVRPRQTWRDYARALREPDTGWFSLLYSLTFGGFVGFTSFLTTFFHEQYHVSKVSAGDFTTLVVVAGSGCDQLAVGCRTEWAVIRSCSCCSSASPPASPPCPRCRRSRSASWCCFSRSDAWGWAMVQSFSSCHNVSPIAWGSSRESSGQQAGSEDSSYRRSSGPPKRAPVPTRRGCSCWPSSFSA